MTVWQGRLAALGTGVSRTASVTSICSAESCSQTSDHSGREQIQRKERDTQPREVQSTIHTTERAGRAVEHRTRRSLRKTTELGVCVWGEVHWSKSPRARVPNRVACSSTTWRIEEHGFLVMRVDWCVSPSAVFDIAFPRSLLRSGIRSPRHRLKLTRFKTHQNSKSREHAHHRSKNAKHACDHCQGNQCSIVSWVHTQKQRQLG